MALQTSPTTEEKRKLNTLLLTAKLDYERREQIREEIHNLTSLDEYWAVKWFLESQQQSIHEMTNPSQRDITTFIYNLK
jgi:hypothetical protein